MSRALWALALLLAAPLAPPGAAEEPCGHVPGVGYACLLPDGHYEVVLADGTRLVTHGPDPLPPRGDIGFDIGDEERQPVCATSSYMHVLYGYPSTDRLDEVAEDLRGAVRRSNAVLNADGLESGDVEVDYRVLCDATNEIRVDSFQATGSGFDAVVNAARAAGHAAPDADYLIFYDGTESGVCGVGNLVLDDRLSADNGNLNGPHYGVTYRNCWFSRTPMHENGHNQGAVQLLAPDTDLGGHCLEGRDVMCYPTSQFLVLCGGRTRFDCDHDTYFDADPEPGEWLATHWNIGSRLNRYLSFADVDPDPPRAGAPAEQEQPDEGEEPGEPTQTGRPTRTPPPEETEEPEEPEEPEQTRTEAPAPVTADLNDRPGRDRVNATPLPFLVALAAVALAAGRRR